MKDLNLSLYIIFYCKEKVSVGFMDALMTYDHFDLDFLRKRKLYLKEILMVKAEESILLDIVVYREYSRELTVCYLPSDSLQIISTCILVKYESRLVKLPPSPF